MTSSSTVIPNFKSLALTMHSVALKCLTSLEATRAESHLTTDRIQNDRDNSYLKEWWRMTMVYTYSLLRSLVLPRIRHLKWSKSSFHHHLGIAEYIWRQNTFFFSLLEEKRNANHWPGESWFLYFIMVPKNMHLLLYDILVAPRELQNIWAPWSRQPSGKQKMQDLIASG